ncbi:MAG TPA: YhbY family RNA-binding protein [Kouleothrix sp.]|uniref:YhbY family RNA-binding protein n=1 Tax=Kouleothrix sp. TaxID=2779161 RepID=UPI002BBE28D3|nr:YhbY family RNA-binding protein [Kouleothrix sp.]HRC74825.1 YhbY family RNA-binding protein [Kouleothrix sp.]
MASISQSQRQFLRRLAHDLKPIVHIGKNGLSDSLFESAGIAIDTHELIKVKFNDLKDERRELAEELAGHLRAELVGVIGNIAIIYRRQPDAERRKIDLPRE